MRSLWGVFLTLIGLLTFWILSGPSADAQDLWPQRPIKLVVPYPAGGVSDAIARHVGRLMEQDLGQAVVIENKGGAGSNIGSAEVAKASPDGYTVLLASSANAVNMYLYKSLAYDTGRDLAPVSLLVEVPNVLVVNADVPFKSIAGLIAAAKQPDGVAYASAGAGSPAHLAAEMFAQAAGIRMHHVPYRGAAPAVNDIIGGHVPLMFTNLASVLGGLQSGKLRLLGIASRKRWPALPEVPTIAESGLPDYEASAWYGLMVPAKTPTSVIDRMQKSLSLARSPASFAQIAKLGAEPVVSSPEQLAERLAAELARYSKLIPAMGLKVE